MSVIESSVQVGLALRPTPRPTTRPREAVPRFPVAGYARVPRPAARARLDAADALDRGPTGFLRGV